MPLLAGQHARRVKNPGGFLLGQKIIYDKDIPITREGLDRLLDDLDEPTKPRA